MKCISKDRFEGFIWLLSSWGWEEAQRVSHLWCDRRFWFSLLISNDFANFPFLGTVKNSWKKNRSFCNVSKIKLATNWFNHWPQTDAERNPMSTNWRSGTACKKNLYWIMKCFKGGVGDNLKEKTLFSLIFYGDTAYTNLFKLFSNYKASSKEYLVKFSWLKIEK